MKIPHASLPALAALALAGAAAAEVPANDADLRVQVQEIVYEVRPDGSARPIDHKVHDVFEVKFEDQYASVDRESENLSFGLVYFEVPRPDQGPNYNVYLYLRDETHEIVTDGYRNNDVDGALFKMTAMLMKRDGDRAYARLMHCFDPNGTEDPELTSARIGRELDRKVRELLARR